MLMENSKMVCLAKDLQNKLLAKGFVVQRYDAYSTNSIYLKLDYGVCNSIRISDHRGKRHLKYRYNIGTFVNHGKQVKDKFDRFYFPVEDISGLIRQILFDRDAKVRLYGKSAYQEFMRKNQEHNAGNKGFWSKAYLVR